MTIVGNIFQVGWVYLQLVLFLQKKIGIRKINDYQQFNFFVEKETFFNKSDYFDEVLFRMCEVV